MTDGRLGTTLDGESGTTMGKVDCCSIDGLDLWFNSNDHLPPHLHVGKRGHWEIRVFILMTTPDHLLYETKFGNPSDRLLRGVRDVVVTYRAELLTEWQRKVRSR